MTADTQRLRAAYRETGLSFLGYTFERAMTVPAIRMSLECKVKDQTKTPQHPVQPVLI